VLISLVPELLRYAVEPAQHALFGRAIVDSDVLRMLLFGVAMVVMMLYRPAGLLPSGVRKREFASAADSQKA
jgi:branched-chain amino acid transport system permease protein